MIPREAAAAGVPPGAAAAVAAPGGGGVAIIVGGDAPLPLPRPATRFLSRTRTPSRLDQAEAAAAVAARAMTQATARALAAAIGRVAQTAEDLLLRKILPVAVAAAAVAIPSGAADAISTEGTVTVMAAGGSVALAHHRPHHRPLIQSASQSASCMRCWPRMRKAQSLPELLKPAHRRIWRLRHQHRRRHRHPARPWQRPGVRSPGPSAGGRGEEAAAADTSIGIDGAAERACCYCCPTASSRRLCL